MKPCPFCAEPIQDAAVVCRYCNRELPKEGGAAPAAASRPSAGDTLKQQLGITPKTPKWQLGCLGIIAVAGVLSFVVMIFREPAADSPRRASAPAAASALTVELDALLGGYKGNEVAADAKYKGKRIRTTGLVGDIKKDILDRPYVTVGHGTDFEIPTVQCFLAASHTGRAASLRKGQSITVTGKVDGLMMNVLMSDCTF